MELTMVQLILLCMCALMVGVSKTGIPNLGTLVAAILAVMFPAKASIGILLPMLLTADLVAVITYRHTVIWRLLVKLIPWVLAGIVMGYFTLGQIDNHQLSLIIGVIVITLIVVHLLKDPLEARFQLKWSQSTTFHHVLGVLAGFTTMVGNAAGGIMAIYFLAKGLKKKEFMGTGAWFYLGVNLLKVPFSMDLGLITTRTLVWNMWMIPLILLGTYIGIRLLKVIPERLFQTLILLFAGIGGVWLLVQGWII